MPKAARTAAGVELVPAGNGGRCRSPRFQRSRTVRATWQSLGASAEPCLGGRSRFRVPCLRRTTRPGGELRGSHRCPARGTEALRRMPPEQNGTTGGTVARPFKDDCTKLAPHTVRGEIPYGGPDERTALSRQIPSEACPEVIQACWALLQTGLAVSTLPGTSDMEDENPTGPVDARRLVQGVCLYLGGRVKSGQRRTGQNRPTAGTRDQFASTLRLLPSATPGGCASSGGRI
jgi:hypothetical protein